MLAGALLNDLIGNSMHFTVGWVEWVLPQYTPELKSAKPNNLV